MNEERIRAYFLGELDENEQERFEAECWAAENWPQEELELVEQELIDDYLQNILTPAQHQRFEDNYLTTPARCERVTQSAALLHLLQKAVGTPALDSVPAPAPACWAWWRQPSWRTATALVCVAILVGAVWLYQRRQPALSDLALTYSNATLGPNGESQIGSIRLSQLPGDLRLTLTLPPVAQGAAGYEVCWYQDGKEIPLPTTRLDTQRIAVIFTRSQLRRGIYPLLLYTLDANGKPQRTAEDYSFMVLE